VAGKTTSQQRLAAMIKRVRDLMRTDPGLNGDLDRLPQLSWLLFAKAFDDLEEQRSALDPDYEPLLQDDYRWAAWGGNPRFTGPALLTFVDEQLVPRLQALRDSKRSELAVKVGTVFSGVENRMRSGYQLREVLNQLNQVHFTSSDDIHTMAVLYESMLREVRDAAGDSGEFYTPRPVIRFMVQQVAPKLGEVVLDPAAGTGGFLVETWEHLRHQAESVKRREQLQGSLRGYEKKPQPYLLGMMNLILHGIDVPQLVQGNALSKLQESRSAAHQVDVVLTNPPFGGAESEDVVKAFPAQYRTAETAWLYMTTVLDKLKVGGRCAIVLPNGVLFGEGVGARIKERLLRECDLHTVVRLPDGVFAPYTAIPTNLLFFDKKAASKKTGWSTKETWFYEIVPPDGRKRYAKTKPMRDEDFAECAEWWGGENRTGRTESSRAWAVPVEQLNTSGFNLDIRNPNGTGDLAHRPPHELVKELIETEYEILALLKGLEVPSEAER
jgi:type I restriction enzyme M protein